jgi:hypothetical protein
VAGYYACDLSIIFFILYSFIRERSVSLVDFELFTAATAGQRRFGRPELDSC